MYRIQVSLRHSWHTLGESSSLRTWSNPEVGAEKTKTRVHSSAVALETSPRNPRHFEGVYSDVHLYMEVSLMMCTI